LKRAIVKRIGAQQVTAETLAAILLRRWGLNVPEPAIVEELPIAFASMDLGYPNLLQRFGWSDSLPEPVRQVVQLQVAGVAAKLAETPTAIAADEAIDNRDRNPGNILWDGRTAAWIDHAVAISLTLTAQIDLVREAGAECGGMAGAEQMAKLVADRLATLASRVLMRFPQPMDLLQQVQH
jgi:hypothetical protein